MASETLKRCPRCGREHRPRPKALANNIYVCRECARVYATTWARSAGRIKPRPWAKRAAKPPPAVPPEAQRFLDWCGLERNLSPNTIRSYTQDLAALAAFAAGRPLLKLGKDDLRAFIRDQAGRESPATVRRRIACVRMAWRFWRDIEESTTHNPAAALFNPRLDQRLPEVLDAREAAALLAAGKLHPGVPGAGLCCELELRDRAALAVLFASGLRAQELCDLALADVDLRAGLLKVHGKGSKDRMVPVAAPAAAALQLYAERARPRLTMDRECGRVFVSRAGMPLCRRDIGRMVKRAAAAAGITKAIHPHTLRHSAATALLRGGAKLLTVQAFLGHTDLKVTSRYLHLAPEELLADYNKAHPMAVTARAARRPALPAPALAAAGGGR